MEIFISSSSLIVDKNVQTILLDIDTLDEISNDDIVIGSGTFRDELMIKSLLDRGLFPLMITLDIDGQIASMFKNLSYLLNVNNYVVGRELIEEIKSVKEFIVSIEKAVSSSKVEENAWLELLVHNQALIYSQVISTGRKGASVAKEILNKIHIYQKKGNSKDSVYVLLEQDNEIKILRTEVKSNSKINKTLIKNQLGKNFKKLMKEHSESYAIFDKDEVLIHKFENITLKYKKEFLIIDQENKKLVDVELTKNFRLKLQKNIDLTRVMFYRLFSKKKKLNEQRELFLKSVHDYLNHKGTLSNVEPLLRTRNLYEGIMNQEKKQNMLSALLLKFIEKIQLEKNQEKDTYFHFAMISLKENWIMEDKYILSNVFEHIANGIDINGMIKKEFSKFIHNFFKYQEVLEEAEEYLEDNDLIDKKMKGFIDMYDLNQRVLEINHVYNIKTLLGEKHDLCKSLNDLYTQLTYQEVLSEKMDDYEKRESFENIQVKKNDYNDFIVLIFASIQRMQGFYKENTIKTKEIANLMAYMAYKLSIDDESINCCYFAFFTIHADRNTSDLIFVLEKYFKNRMTSDDTVMEFCKKYSTYNCIGDKEKIIFKQESFRDKKVKCEKFRKNKIDKFEPNLKKIGNFFKLIASREKMDKAMDISKYKILKTNIKSEIYCQNEITLNFLAIFLSGKTDCNKRLSNFFTCFKAEYEKLNHTHYNQ